MPSDKPSQRVVGLMSGTSADGMDAVLLEVTPDPVMRVLKHAYEPYDASMRAALLALMHDQRIDVVDLMTHDRQWSVCAERLVRQLMVGHGGTERLTVVGMHGQTIRHVPGLSSWQIGDPGYLSARLGCPVVADLRRGDMALGGQGAPFIPAFQRALWGIQPDVAYLNGGGICNLTGVHEGQLLGFDVGPCNSLLDAWAQRHLGKPYDDQGAWAAQGTVLPELLKRLNHHPYMQKPPPKSLCRTDCSIDALRGDLPRHARPVDVQATWVAWMVESVRRACAFFPQIKTLYLFGGVVHNRYFVESLVRALAPCRVATTEDLGWSPQTLEAAAFGWLAWMRWRGEAIDLQSVTGAARPCVLGGLYQV